jgi:hypothetical protein
LVGLVSYGCKWLDQKLVYYRRGKPGTEMCQKRGLPLNFVVSRITITGKSVFRVSSLRTASPSCFRDHYAAVLRITPEPNVIFVRRRLECYPIDPSNRPPVFNEQTTTLNSSHDIGVSVFQRRGQQATKLRQQSRILHYATYRNEELYPNYVSRVDFMASNTFKLFSQAMGSM